jgi:hypothetical protein
VGLQSIVQDARQLLGTLDGHQLANSEAVREAVELLSQILAQDITEPGDEASSPSNNDSNEADEEESDSEEGPRIWEGVATDRVISTVDPEMRHGRKSSSQRFDGYKVHVTEALDSEFITGVAVTPGNQHDGEVAEELAWQVRERFGQAPVGADRRQPLRKPRPSDGPGGEP